MQGLVSIGVQRPAPGLPYLLELLDVPEAVVEGCHGKIQWMGLIWISLQ